MNKIFSPDQIQRTRLDMYHIGKGNKICTEQAEELDAILGLSFENLIKSLPNRKLSIFDKNKIYQNLYFVSKKRCTCSWITDRTFQKYQVVEYFYAQSIMYVAICFCEGNIPHFNRLGSIEIVSQCDKNFMKGLSLSGVICSKELRLYAIHKDILDHFEYKKAPKVFLKVWFGIKAIQLVHNFDDSWTNAFGNVIGNMFGSIKPTLVKLE